MIIAGVWKLTFKFELYSFFIMEEYEELLEPIKKQWNNKMINDQEAVELLLYRLGKSSEKQDSDEYQKFKRLSKLLFKGETFLNIAYQMPSGKIYKFYKASEHYTQILFSIYRYLSAKDFSNEEEILSLMKKTINNKRILELGCGIGFNIKVLNNLGAKTSGMDIFPELKGKVEGIDLRIGDCENLQEVFNNEAFDIIYSMDFFTDSILSYDKSKKILKNVWDMLKPGGLAINHIIYEEVHTSIILLSLWLYCQKYGGDSISVKESYFKNNPKILYSNESSLNKKDYESQGFKVLNFCKEGREFVIIAKKPY